MRLMAVDPGLRSGRFVWRDGVWTADIWDPMELLAACVQEIGAGLDVLVVEAYRVTAQTAKLSAQNWSLELIGALRWMAHEGVVPFVLQTPADAKSFVPDQRLRDLGMWTPGREDHARDSVRHGVVALAKRGELRVPPIGG